MWRIASTSAREIGFAAAAAAGVAEDAVALADGDGGADEAGVAPVEEGADEDGVAAGGRDTISGPLNGHDDVANAVAGAAALSQYGGYRTDGAWISGPPEPPEDPKLREERVTKLIKTLLRGAPVPF